MAGMGSCQSRDVSWKWKERSEESDRASMRSTQSGIGSSVIEKVVVFVVALVMSVVAQPGMAQSYDNASLLPTAAATSASFNATNPYTMWVSRDIAGFGTQYFSAIRMGPNWGLTAGHGLGLGSNFRVGSGSNWMTDRGIEQSITSSIFHPGYVPGSSPGTGVDLVAIFWDTPITGATPTIAPISIGEVLSYDGFGRPATPGTGLLPSDGQRRIFRTWADQFGSTIAGFSTDYVVGTFFSPAVPGRPALIGAGTSGNSGSGVYNSSNQLVAMAVAASGSPNYTAATYSLRLDLYQPWIASIPTPGSFALLAVGGLFAARRRRG